MSTNKVFIATSLDGYIADADNKIDWLHELPVIENEDMGYAAFTQSIDAMVMGRNTFETVDAFDIPWPYQKTVFVLSNTLDPDTTTLPNNVFPIKGELKSVIEEIENKGYHSLYIDGGRTIQSFLKEDLIDELVITIIPVLLGSGIPLFAQLNDKLKFKCSRTQRFENGAVQNTFVRASS